MLGNRDGCAGRESTPAGAGVVDSYTATVYFQQATSLLKRGLFAESETYLRKLLHFWPDHAGAWNNLGTAIWHQKRAQEAEQSYRQALELAPDDFGILNNLGNALWEQDRHLESIPLYHRALQIQPDAWETHMNLGVALSDHGDFEQALRSMRTALRLRPDSPEILDNLGMTLARQGHWEEALDFYEQALRLRPDFPEAHRNRAFMWLARGDLERGWPEYEWRRRCRNYRPLTFPGPEWTGEDLGGRSILLHTEQGLGDTLQFLRFAAVVRQRGGWVVMSCPPPLARLLALCPYVQRVIAEEHAVPDWDFHIPLMSLPALLGTTWATLPAQTPYLFVDEATVERWGPVVARARDPARDGPAGRARDPGRCFTIGIAWQGNPLNRADRRRSFPLSQLAPLAGLPGVRVVSLQKGEGTDQLAGLAGRFPVAVLHDPVRGEEDRRDFLDTAAVMKQLDLVIAPESAVAHLAGGLGVRVWVALAEVSDWRWLTDRDDSPWYPTMTLFRQSTPGDWEGVFRRMAEVLSRELSAGPQLPRRQPRPGDLDPLADQSRLERGQAFGRIPHAPG